MRLYSLFIALPEGNENFDFVYIQGFNYVIYTGFHLVCK